MIVKLALLFVCVTLASGNPAAGKPWLWKSPKPFMTPIGPVKSSRIVGGQEATPHSYPHLAALIIDGMYFCSGSLISTEWVLTAAHCLDGAGYVEVVLGAHNIGENEATQVTITSTDFTVHENYNIITLSNDIAVIRLPQPVTLNDYINTVGLPSYDLQVGTTVTLTGWGKPSDSSGISPVLLEVEVPVIDNSVCNSVYGIITDGNFCTDSSGGQGTCGGDSGGPAHQNGMIHGIVSFVSSAGCEAGYPNTLTRVRYFLDWIEAHTGVIP